LLLLLDCDDDLLCEDERDLPSLCEDERDFSLRDDFSLCEDERDFCSGAAGAGAGIAMPSGEGADTNFGAGAGAAVGADGAGDECSRLLAGLPACVCDGADCDGVDFDAERDADADADAEAEAEGADCDAEVDELDGARRFSSDLPGEITFGSGYADGGATSWTIGFASRRSSRSSRLRLSGLSDLPGEITFGVG